MSGQRVDHERREGKGYHSFVNIWVLWFQRRTIEQYSVPSVPWKLSPINFQFYPTTQSRWCADSETHCVLIIKDWPSMTHLTKSELIQEIRTGKDFGFSILWDCNSANTKINFKGFEYLYILEEPPNFLFFIWFKIVFAKQWRAPDVLLLDCS